MGWSSFNFLKVLKLSAKRWSKLEGNFATKFSASRCNAHASGQVEISTITARHGLDGTNASAVSCYHFEYTGSEFWQLSSTLPR